MIESSCAEGHAIATKEKNVKNCRRANSREFEPDMHVNKVMMINIDKKPILKRKGKTSFKNYCHRPFVFD